MIIGPDSLYATIFIDFSCRQMSSNITDRRSELWSPMCSPWLRQPSGTCSTISSTRVSWSLENLELAKLRPPNSSWSICAGEIQTSSMIDPVLWDEIWRKVQNDCYFCTATLRTFLWRVKTKSSRQLQFDKQTIVVDDFCWVFIRKLGMRRSLIWYFILLRLVLSGCRARKLI